MCVGWVYYIYMYVSVWCLVLYMAHPCVCVHKRATQNSQKLTFVYLTKSKQKINRHPYTLHIPPSQPRSRIYKTFNDATSFDQCQYHQSRTICDRKAHIEWIWLTIAHIQKPLRSTTSLHIWSEARSMAGAGQSAWAMCVIIIMAIAWL